MTLTQIDAYVLTLLVEAIAAFLLARPFKSVPWRASLAAVLGSALSHPIFWPSYLFLAPRLGIFTTPITEGLVVLFESLFYRLLATKDWRIALLLSALVNLASWLTGQLIYLWR